MNNEKRIRPTNEQEAVLYFLDCDSYEEKWNALATIHDFLSDYVIDTLAVAMDVVIPDGDLEERYRNLQTCINAHRRFEVKR